MYNINKDSVIFDAISLDFRNISKWKRYIRFQYKNVVLPFLLIIVIGCKSEIGNKNSDDGNKISTSNQSLNSILLQKGKYQPETNTLNTNIPSDDEKIDVDDNKKKDKIIEDALNDIQKQKNKKIKKQKNKNIITQIDILLGAYYKLMNRRDYFDDDGIGKFAAFCDDNGFDDDDVCEELEEEECTLEDFADDDDIINFPFSYPYGDPTKKKEIILKILKTLKTFCDEPGKLCDYKSFQLPEYNYYKDELIIEKNHVSDSDIEKTKSEYRNAIKNEFDPSSGCIQESIGQGIACNKIGKSLPSLQYWEKAINKPLIEPFDNVYILNKLYSVGRQDFNKESFFKNLKQKLQKITSNKENNISNLLEDITVKRSTMSLSLPSFAPSSKFKTGRKKIISILYACMQAWGNNKKHNVNFVFVGENENDDTDYDSEDNDSEDEDSKYTPTPSSSELWKSIKSSNSGCKSFTYNIPINEETFSKKDLDSIIEELSDKRTKDLFNKITPFDIKEINSKIDIILPKYSGLQQKIEDAIKSITNDNDNNNRQRVTVVIYLNDEKDENEIKICSFHPPLNKIIPKDHHFGWISMASNSEIMNIGNKPIGAKNCDCGELLYLVCAEETGMNTCWRGQKYGCFINTHTLLKMFSNIFLGSWDITQQTTTTEKGKNDDDCPICMNPLNNGKVRELDCKQKKNHSFHDHCIGKWLRIKGTCPLCREPQNLQNFQKPQKPQNSIDIEI